MSKGVKGAVKVPPTGRIRPIGNGSIGPFRTDAEYIAAVRQALAEGAHLDARQLASEGYEKHPGNDELRRMAKVLAPPRIISTNLPANPGIALNARWLKESASEYKGQWVAVYNGELLGSAATLSDLTQKIQLPKGTLLTKVF